MRAFVENAYLEDKEARLCDIINDVKTLFKEKVMRQSDESETFLTDLAVRRPEDP